VREKSHGGANNIECKILLGWKKPLLQLVNRIFRTREKVARSRYVKLSIRRETRSFGGENPLDSPKAFFLGSMRKIERSRQKHLSIPRAKAPSLAQSFGGCQTTPPNKMRKIAMLRECLHYSSKMFIGRLKPH